MMWRAAISFSRALGLVLVHDVDAVADALGVAELDGLADVEAEAVGRDEAGSEFAGVERDVHLRIDAVEVVEHQHLAVVLGHGEVAVFGLNEVDADDAWDGLIESRRSKPRRVWAKTCCGGKPRRTW